ncbi:MAG: pyrroloquinoline quinone-dependent dehydrogenase [Rhodospirillaceae bacterium]|nr:pyrroloquinoline quinone-dependent dehydrogenase [Rhodospirillaceae bacterium]
MLSKAKPSSIALVLALAFSPAVAEPIDPRAWESYAGTPGGGRYSALEQITRDNVGRLRVAWRHDSGDVAADPAEKRGLSSYEVTPLVADGTLYYCTPLNKVIALDAATGGEKWRFDAHAAFDLGPVFAANCRGVALWRDRQEPPVAACRTRIFRGDAVGRLFAIDAETGRPCADFGAGGMVDLKDFDYGGAGAPALMSPPAVIGDLVIVGGSVGDNAKADTVDGIVRAFDTRTGAERWSFNPIPAHLSAATGAANVWSAITVDVERGLLFLPTSSPSPDFYGVQRSDPIPHANAVVALNAADGSVAWSYQIVRHDLFDYDLPEPPALITVRRDGAEIPAVAQITKMGFLFVLDRVTGQPLFPVEDRAVAASDIPGETASPTQPVPVLPAPFARQVLTADDMWGLTFWDRGKCRDVFQASRYEGLFTPASERGTVMYPSALGGGNWGGLAVDPRTATAYVKSQNIGTTVRLIRKEPDYKPGPFNMARWLDMPMHGTPYRLVGEQPFLSPWGVPCTPPPWGTMTAIDLNTGATKWQVPIGQVAFGPGGLLKTPKAWGSPNVGGLIATAGGLVFMAGTMDSRIHAYDQDSGAVLWSADLPAPGMATPMTYEAGGRQFVVIAAGGNSLAGTRLDDAIVAFALP